MYRATDPSLQAVVAVKVLADNWSRDPAARRRFRAEAVLLRRAQSGGSSRGWWTCTTSTRTTPASRTSILRPTLSSLSMLSVPSSRLQPLADSVREGSGGLRDDIWSGLVAALELADGGGEGSLFTRVDDAALTGLVAAGGAAGDAPDAHIDFERGTRIRLGTVLATIIRSNPVIRSAFAPGTADDVSLDELRARPGVASSSTSWLGPVGARPPRAPPSPDW